MMPVTELHWLRLLSGSENLMLGANDIGVVYVDRMAGTISSLRSAQWEGWWCFRLKAYSITVP